MDIIETMRTVEMAMNEFLTADRLLMLYFIFNSAVQALPDPDSRSTKLYRFLYGFLHTIAGNIALVRKQARDWARPPSMPPTSDQSSRGGLGGRPLNLP